jgi:hypothetical protein
MKTLKCFALALVGFTAPALSAAVSGQAWLETYYLDPHPEEMPRAIQRLSAEGYFDHAANVPIAIGFISTVFAQHARDVDQWLPQLNGLPLKHQRLIAAALWQSGHPLGAELLPLLGQFSRDRAQIASLATTPTPLILDTPVLSASSMNLHWGAFLANGDERHLLAIFEAIGLDRPGLDAAARTALAQHAVDHPRVLDICRSQLGRQPAEVQGVLRAALDAAGAPPPHG